MTLFDLEHFSSGKKRKTDDISPRENMPLAARMRPQNLDEFVGQEHLVGEGRVLRKLIESDQIPSMIFWGPPGVVRPH